MIDKWLVIFCVTAMAGNALATFLPLSPGLSFNLGYMIAAICVNLMKNDRQK